MSHEKDTRLGAFLVGCPRSGTTMLQSQLARHPDLITFPESHFFDRMLAGRGTVRRLMGLPRRNARKNLLDYAARIGVAHSLPYGYWRLRSDAQLTHAFVALLSGEADARDAAVWLEKTPGHSHYIGYICRHVPQSRFVHLIRDGRDVVASLYRVTREYPEYWSGVWSLEMCVQRWQRAIRDSLAWRDADDRHFILFYDDLVREPRAWLDRLWQFFNLDPDDLRINVSGSSGPGHIHDFEGWKAKSLGGINALAQEDKFASLSTEHRAYVEDVISNMDLAPLRAAAQRRCT